MIRRGIYACIIWIDGFVLRARIKVGARTESAFLRRYNFSLQKGKNDRDALLSVITFFRFRGPFVYLSDEDVKNLLNLSSPVNVAKHLQRCVEAKSIKPIRESISPRRDTFAEYAERMYEEIEI